MVRGRNGRDQAVKRHHNGPSWCRSRDTSVTLMGLLEVTLLGAQTRELLGVALKVPRVVHGDNLGGARWPSSPGA